MVRHLTAVVLAALNLMGLAFVYAQDPAKTVKLESPYFVFPRLGDKHIDLSSDWILTASDAPVESIAALAKRIHHGGVSDVRPDGLL